MICNPEFVSASHYEQDILKQVHNDGNLTQHSILKQNEYNLL